MWKISPGKVLMSVLPIAFLIAIVIGVLAASVDPVTYTNWQSGNAEAEWMEAGQYGDFYWKIDASAPNGNYDTSTGDYGNTPVDPEFAAIITISNSDGVYFDWSCDFPVYAVIVKGGPSANVYIYEDGAYSDTDLCAPTNPNNGQPYGISHVTFCWSDNEDDDGYYQEETAWAYGTRYVNKGNWAMYVAYDGEEMTVDILAGQTMDAGYAVFSDPYTDSNDDSVVDITITLENTFIFYYDIADEEQDDNIKVQDYSTTPPAKNPAPGQFDWKTSVEIGETTCTITVPENNYYGVHLDVAYWVSY